MVPNDLIRTVPYLSPLSTYKKLQCEKKKKKKKKSK